MSALPTRIEREAGRPLTPLQIFDITAAREATLSRLLMLYISTGLLFMLLPGTFLGVWNLLAISSHHAADSVSPAWIQAHGHAQIFGWIGTFILGIGFYSIPKLRRLNSFALSAVWSSWVLWTIGVTLRWLTSVYQWEWRVLLPLSAALELAAFVIFFRTVSGHRPQESGKTKLEVWVFVVIAGSVGLLLTLLVNFAVTSASRSTRHISGNTRGLRSTFSRPSDLGVLGPVCMGIQCQVASSISRTATGARAGSIAGGRSELRRRFGCLRGFDDGRESVADHRNDYCSIFAAIA
jgi:multisubunit Na+/H+ antiporter MnhB subunit